MALSGKGFVFAEAVDNKKAKIRDKDNMLTDTVLRAAVCEAVFQLALQGPISLRTLREVLQVRLDVDLRPRRAFIKQTAQEAVDAHAAVLIRSAQTEKDCGRQLFTDLHDRQWQGLWEPLVQVRSHVVANVLLGHNRHQESMPEFIQTFVSNMADQTVTTDIAAYIVQQHDNNKRENSQPNVLSAICNVDAILVVDGGWPSDCSFLFDPGGVLASNTFLRFHADAQIGQAAALDGENSINLDASAFDTHNNAQAKIQRAESLAGKQLQDACTVQGYHASTDVIHSLLLYAYGMACKSLGRPTLTRSAF